MNAVPNIDTTLPTLPSLTDNSRQWVTIPLSQSSTLTNIIDLHKQLQQNVGRRVQLYGAEVERIDTATLQLLLAFISQATVTIGWQSPSSVICEAAMLLDLSAQLNLPKL
ncbi:hypothetical protein [Beggiatoa leptomitoformis]|uniref:STAS domain-containing protein n=1 Tax=Beggiatoa leptomitoformis TaxID=288004 RepID=A0A2N9YF59_9GAMM|nr:hypothetical protein [Beggiatoa leptomitoformis]ALG68547.1 hypothetical protein AL038_13640 [Beggiatoa leptomitoformis]AUI69107.1 hypothetical protein BLE401_10620 [Beggiatoa leptomitoformis]